LHFAGLFTDWAAKQRAKQQQPKKKKTGKAVAAGESCGARRSLYRPLRAFLICAKPVTLDSDVRGIPWGIYSLTKKPDHDV